MLHHGAVDSAPDISDLPRYHCIRYLAIGKIVDSHAIQIHCSDAVIIGLAAASPAADLMPDKSAFMFAKVKKGEPKNCYEADGFILKKILSQMAVSHKETLNQLWLLPGKRKMKNSMCLRNHSHRVFYFRQHADWCFQRSARTHSRHRRWRSQGFFLGYATNKH